MTTMIEKQTQGALDQARSVNTEKYLQKSIEQLGASHVLVLLAKVLDANVGDYGDLQADNWAINSANSLRHMAKQADVTYEYTYWWESDTTIMAGSGHGYDSVEQLKADINSEYLRGSAKGYGWQIDRETYQKGKLIDTQVVESGRGFPPFA